MCMTPLIATGLGTRRLLIVGLVCIFPYLGSNVVIGATPDPVRSQNGVVAADHHSASKVGARVLANGGNAVDAAVATALALGVVNPASSGIGGGGFALIYIASEKKTYVVDFREMGPAAISPKLFVRNGKVDTNLSQRGGLAVGVPGEIAGLEYLVKRFGKRSWRRAVLPAHRLASRGFVASRFLHSAAKFYEKTIKPQSQLGQLLFTNEKLFRRGQIIKRPKLARTLWQLATRGGRAYYRGKIAQDIVSSTRAAGGVLTMKDMANYRVVSRKPLIGQWNGYRVATMPVPSSGGVVLLEALGIIGASGQDLRKHGANSSATMHIIAEALKHAFADRSRFLGDTNPAKLTSSKLLDAARLKRLGGLIKLDTTLPHGQYGDKKLGAAKAPPAKGGGTSHLCVVDRHGNAVALTTTVNGYFGAKLVTDKTGIVLNNQIDDFSLKSGVANMYGLVQSDFNLVGPGKRPLSSMSPTLVFKRDKVVGCFGGSGGPKIISNTMQTIINTFVFGMDPAQAVSAPRLHHQWTPNVLLVNQDTPADVVMGLKRRGHKIKQRSWRFAPTAVQAVTVDSNGMRKAASDPRKGGLPAAQR